jgi:mono/diheme cytochrome c family protein
MRLAPLCITVGCLAVLAAGCGGGETTAHHERYLWMQHCANCHGISADATPPDPAAPNILAHPPSVEAVRRAVNKGAPGMPPGLLGGSDVDQIAAYVTGSGS